MIDTNTRTHSCAKEESTITDSPLWRPETGDQQHWARAVNQLGTKTLSIELGEPRFLIMERISKAKLSHTPYISLGLNQFLEDPSGMLKAIPCSAYIAYVEPLVSAQGRLKRYRINSVTALSSMCRELKEKFPIEECMITLLCAPLLEFHGGAIVDSEGWLVTAEFVTGKSPHVSRPGVVPQYCVAQDRFTWTFKYNFADPEIRQILYNCLQALPNGQTVGSFRQPGFLPGYYELVVCRDDTGQRQYYLHDFKPWKGR